MNPIEKLKLLVTVNKDAGEIEEGMKTKNATKVITGVVAIATAVITATPQIQAFVGGLEGHHPAIAAAITGIITILTLLHNPKASQ